MGNKRRSHKIDYEIFGTDIQYVEIELDPGETVIAEPGAMMYLEEDITFEAKMGDGADPSWRVLRKFKSAALRKVINESVFIAHFTHSGSNGKRKAAFGAPFPGEIVSVDLSDIGGEILVQRTGFLCAAKGTKLQVDYNRGMRAGAFGGLGFALVSLSGDGLAFIHAGGSIIGKHLNDETLRIATGCIVAFEPRLQYSASLAGGAKARKFGGEGTFLSTLSGTGTVWVQSLPFDCLAREIWNRLDLDESKE